MFEIRFLPAFVMRCAIWYHVYNLKNVKNTHGGLLLLATLLKVTLLHGCFSHFLNCTNVTKSHNASHMQVEIVTQTFLLSEESSYFLNSMAQAPDREKRSL